MAEKNPEPEYIVKWRSLCWIAFWGAMAVYMVFGSNPIFSITFTSP